MQRRQQSEIEQMLAYEMKMQKIREEQEVGFYLFKICLLIIGDRQSLMRRNGEKRKRDAKKCENNASMSSRRYTPHCVWVCAF